MMRKYIVGLMVGVAISLTGCESWLDVKPEDQVSENELFSTPQGFRNALNGVYIDLNKSALYGETLTFKHVEALAQNYSTGEGHSLQNWAAYEYGQSNVKNLFQSTWDEMYKQIGNINLFISQIEGKKRNVLSASERDMLNGEALALRALMHFDLFRLFAPAYTVDSAAVSLPYYEQYDGIVQEFLPGTEFCGRIIRDLDRAEALLVHDPVVTEGNIAEPEATGGVATRYRGLRLNYYAVLALQARVALYMNRPERALSYARRVIVEAGEAFPFAESDEWVFEANDPDRVLSAECLFSLQSMKREDLFQKNFVSTLDAAQFLGPDKKSLEELYSAGDWRLRSWWEKNDVEVESDEGTQIVTHYSLLKYRKTQTTSELFNTLVPMIRKSEMYYIAAEVLCATDVDEAQKLLEEVRHYRGFTSYPEAMTQEEVQDEILQEYRKEFYGEGQLFFFYKRKNFTEIPDGTDITATVKMDVKKYVVPLPDSEMKFRD